MVTPLAVSRILALGCMLWLSPWLVFANGDDNDLMQRDPWAACEYCHGADGRIDSPSVPAIAGQSASYIRKQLADFRAGRRVSPQLQMRSAMMLLDEQDDAEVAEHFAAQKPLRSAPIQHDKDRPAANLYWSGRPGHIACAACHPVERKKLAANNPILFGLNRDYLVRQLQAFRAGTRTNDPDRVMQSQAASLTDEEIESLADFLSVN